MSINSRISEYEAAAEEQLHAAQQWATDMIDDRPVATLCSVFAVGFAIGAGIAAAMVAASPPPRTWRSRLGNNMEGMADRMSEAICNALPKNVSQMWQR